MRRKRNKELVLLRERKRKKAKKHGEQNPEFSFSSPVHKVVFNPYSEPAPKLRQMFFSIFLSKLNFTLLIVRECGGKSFVYDKG